ncbi:biotin-dependent carboxyltransferase family protein [Amycolatopsis sp. NPDC059657]|uniref:5-oxoprolinase subunit C family protein n=1 Tax=Amycolatopsis sp. NPDC059657 TaxID=3346899 RepID=UPI003672863B
MKFEVLAPGPQTTVQDLGRPGLAALGVGRAGAADRASLRLANRLVGNPESHAALEVTFGGLRVRFSEDTWVAVTGAACVVRGGRSPGLGVPILVRAGEDFSLDAPSQGLRNYVAVRGGVEVAPVLGSRSTDTLAKLGPPALTAGMTVPIGRGTLAFPAVDLAPQRAFPDQLVLHVTPGPRWDWFVPGTLAQLASAPFQVTSDVSRVGVRLAGPSLVRANDAELPPEAAVPGALQVPPAGNPILFLADHPVTGGYPVVAVVDEADVDLAAQARPGQSVRFVLRNRIPGA